MVWTASKSCLVVWCIIISMRECGENTCQRNYRHVVLGQKNWENLFVGDCNVLDRSLGSLDVKLLVPCGDIWGNS
jgi:hypothetical protein